MMRTFTVVVVALLATAFLSACGSGAGPDEEPAAEAPAQAEPAQAEPAQAAGEDVAALVEARCTTCHGMAKVESFDGHEPWADVVEEMRQKPGANISEEEAARISAYLNEKYAL